VQADASRPTKDSWPPASTLYSLLIGLAGLGWLGYNLIVYRQPFPWPALLVFAGLSFLVQRSSFHLGSPTIHSLAGVIDLAAVLALGPTMGAVVAAFSGLTYLELNALRHHRPDRYHLIDLPLFNAGLKGLMAFAAGAVFRPLPLGAEGLAPTGAMEGQSLLALGSVCLLWFLLDHTAWGLLEYLQGGREQLRLFFHQAIPSVLLVELLPLPFSLVVALVYTHLSWVAFAIQSLVIIAVAVLARRWATTRTKLTQRVAELSTIEQIGAAIAQAQLDVDEICKLMYEHARRIADTTIFHLGLFEGDDYTLKLWMREGQPQPPRTFRLTPGVGLINWMRDSKQPLLVGDFEKDPLPAQPVYIADHPPRSALFVPLIAGETVIGTMTVQSFRRHAYGESDLRVLSAMANQAAVAIQKAQLYAQEHKRVRQLATIGQVSRQVTATLELEELFRRVVGLIRENFGYYHVGVFTADRERRTVTFQASASAGQHPVAVEVAWGEGLIGWAAAHGQPVVVNDVTQDARYRWVEALEETRSELVVPLLLDDELVGLLDVQSDQPNAFGPDDLFILETLGRQVAIAIHEARLYEAERQQAWFATALLQVADTMSHVSDLDAVLTTIVRLTPLLAGVDRCALLLWDDGSETFIPAQTYGLSRELRETFDHLSFPAGGFPALDLVRWQKTPRLVRVADEPGLVPPDLVHPFEIREVLLLPLLAQGELLGAMMVDYAGTAHPFHQRLVEMLVGIANQAAMVIHSARLVQAQQEEAYVSMALLQVAEAVSRSTELAETLAAIARITPMLVGVEMCAFFLWDQASATFVPFQQYGLREPARSTFAHLRLAEEDPLVRELLAGRPFVTLRDLHRLPETGRSAAGSGLAALGRESLLTLPLISKGEVLGLMSVDYTGSTRRFTGRWVNILTGIAGQAAIAVENDRLLREAAEQERMKQELDVARRIQTSFLPEQCPQVPGWELAVLWRSARQVGGDFYDFFPLPPAREMTTGNRVGLVVADVADKGVPAALFMALSRTLVRTVAMDGRPPAAAIARANDLILADARAGLFVTLCYAVLHPDSGEVVYVNAGHMPPLLVRAADGTGETLAGTGMALGVMPHIEFEEQRVHLEPDDLLLFYTDGVLETLNAQQRMFGRERLLQVVSSHRHLPVMELTRVVDEALTAFSGDLPQFDDLTLVVARRKRAEGRGQDAGGRGQRAGTVQAEDQGDPGPAYPPQGG